MKLGSLFDGSGGFPLAGVLHGVEPAWASEIEPYPMRVTTARFPVMKHLGDVTKIDGAAIEPVDIITFGSPCQDLSVAGKGAGLQDGTRSNLFYEAIRIIKEMRNATENLYPRIAVWENVPGAYSSNKGEDFRSVLQAFCSVKDETADVPRPAAGKWNPAGAIVGDGWSVAWRTLDAQFWGVPQRRRRIYLVADFGTERAGEILFEQEGSHRNTAKGASEREGVAGDAERSAGRGVLFEPMSALEEATPPLKAVPSGSNTVPDVCYALQGNGIDRADTAGCNGAGWRENVMYTLNTIDRPAVCYSEDCRNINLTKEHGTLQAKDNGGQSLNYMGAVCYIPSQFAKYVDGNPTLRASGGDLGGGSEGLVCYPIDSHQQDSRFKICEDGVCPTVPGQMGTGGNNDTMVLEAHSAGNGQLHQALEYEKARPLDCMHDQQIVLHPSKPPRRYIIRRLTPLECLRLQGLPDWWLDGVDGSDSAKYKMLGNGIAMPNAIYVVGCAVQLLQEGKHENEG